MTSRNHLLGLGVALSFGAAGLTFSTAVLAEEAVPPPDAPPADVPTEDAPADVPPSAAEPPPVDPAPAEPVADPSEAEATAEAEGSVSLGGDGSAGLDSAGLELGEREDESAPEADSGTKSDTSAEREKAVALLGVEMLPGSAYPSPQVRGIKYGSLWRTFHGLQWPYMPVINDEPGVRIGLSGYMWNDLSNTRLDADEALRGTNVNDQNRWTTQSRGVLRVTPTYAARDDWFVQGNGEIVVQGDMRPDQSGVLATTDDLWVRIGKWDLFDVTVGRFQGWEIANHYGMALDQNTLERSGALIVGGPGSSLPPPTDGYGLTYFWDRQNYTLGAYALHLYPTEYLRAEILSHIGAGAGNAGNPYQMDIRPSAIFDIGWVKVKAGWEYGKSIPQDVTERMRDAKNGFGFAAQFVIDPYVEFGGSFARGFQDVVDVNAQPDLSASSTVQTVGGFVNGSPGHEPLVIGAGAFLNHFENFRYDTAPGPHQGKVDTNDQLLLYGAVQYTLFERFNLKAVVSHASHAVEHWRSGEYVNNALSGRFRAELLF